MAHCAKNIAITVYGTLTIDGGIVSNANITIKSGGKLVIKDGGQAIVDDLDNIIIETGGLTEIYEGEIRILD